MKKNYFKKSLSLVLTVLMLMSCWVFVAPTEADAIDAGDAVAAYNKALLDQINTDVDTNMTKTSGTFHFAGNGDQSSAATTDRRNKSFVNVLYSPDVTSAVGAGVSFSGVPNADGVRVWYPDTVLMYDGGTAKMGVLLEADASKGNSLRCVSCWIDSGATGFKFVSNSDSSSAWKGIATDDSCFYYVMYDSDKSYCLTSDGQNTSTKWGTDKGVWTFFANHLVFNGTMGDTEWVRNVKPTWKYRGGSGDDSIYTATASHTIYLMNIKAYKNLLTDISNKRGSLNGKEGQYTRESLQKFVNACYKITNDLAPKKFVSTTSNNVTSWASQMSTAYTELNNAYNGLVKRNVNVGYENLFSISDWAQSASSVAVGNGTTGEVIFENNDTVRIYKSGAGNEVTTSSSYSGNHKATMYSIPVTGGKDYTVRYDIEASVNGTAQSEVFMFWYDANNTPVNNTAGSATFNNKGFGSTGACSVTFTAPASATKAEIRFDNDCPSAGSTLRFKNIAVYPAERNTAVEVDTWSTRPVTKTVKYGSTLSGKLDVPVRNGYTFNGWYIDNVNVNGVKDSDEEVTDAAGNVTKSVTVTDSINLYADWKPLPMDIGYDNIFSLAEWAKTNSVKASSTNGTIAYDVMAGTITAESTANGEVYNVYGTGADQYVIAVEPNTEYIFEADMDLVTGDKGQMFVFFYNASGSGVSGAIYNGAVQSAPHIGIYPTTEGTSSITFTTPADCTKMAFRVGATNVGTKAVYSNIGFYKKADYDAYAKDYATIRVPFNFGDTTNLSLVPTRAGYQFDGWYTASGTKLTSVSGLKASDTVYAKWIQLFTVTFKNWDGTVLKTQQVAPGAAATAPNKPSKAADASYEYTFDKWDTDFSAVASDLVVTATYKSKDHTGISKTYQSGATCTSAAKYTQLCTACGFVWTEVFEDPAMSALGHTFERANPSSTVVTGTSTGKADTDLHTIKCNACDATTQVKHDFKDDATRPGTTATCTVKGWTYTKCACLETQEIEGQTNPNNHVNTITINVQDPACGVKGYTGDTYCNDCEKIVATGTEIKALEHEYTNYVYNEDAKCGVNGTETALCDLCGKVPVTREAANTALNHLFTNYVDQGDATCDKAGTEIATCDRDDCNEKDSRSTGKKRAHEFTGAVKNNEDGTHEFKCKYNDCAVYGGKVNCGYGAWTKDNAATHSHTCTTCGYIPAAEAHKWDDWSQVETNNGNEAGSMKRSCIVCGREETTECKYTYVVTPATCEKDGYTTYACTDVNCGHGYTVIDLGSATGHDFSGAYTYDAVNDKHQQACVNKDCTDKGVVTTKDAWATCTWTYATVAGEDKHTATCVCGNSEKQDCSGGEATCTAQAECQFCKTAYGEKAAHDITGTEKYLKKATDATCIANETYYKYCINCEKEFGTETYEKPDTKTPHDYTCKDEYLYIATQAKCGVNETYYAYCSNPDCKKSSEDANNTFEKADTALKHVWVDAQHNADTLTHTFTCERGCGETMTANCADAAVSFGYEPATCTEQGYDIVQCSACGHQWNINYTAALGHDYTQKIYDEAHLKSAANCEQANVYYYDCSRCDKNAKDETDTDKYTTLTFISGDVRKHDWKNVAADDYLAVPATCTAAPKYYPSCSYDDCDAKDTSRTFSSGSALGHDFTEKIQDEEHLISAADCVNGSKYYYDCSRCNENAKNDKDSSKYTYTLEDYSGHSMAYTAAKAATCYAEGNLEYWYCDACKKYYKDAEGKDAYLGLSETVIEMREHDLASFSFKAATCEEDGHPAYDDCKYDDCDYTTYPEKLDDGYKAIGHNFTGAYVYDSVNLYHSKLCANGCGVSGMVVDGAQVKYEVTFNGEDEAVIVGGTKCEFTYTESTKDGIHTHANACVCGNSTTKTYSDEETFVETIVPTCTTKGYDSYACKDCGATWTKNEKPANDHTPADKATSNGDGTHSVKCTVEGCGYKISTANCSGGQATCKDQAICEVCGGAYGETGTHVYAEGSKWVYQNDAKCGVNGTEKNTCTACGTEVSREAVGTALEHKMTAHGYEVPKELKEKLATDGIIIVEPTCGDEGNSISYCEYCYYYETMIVKADKNKHVWATDDEGNKIWNMVSGSCATGYTYVCRCINDCGTVDTKTEPGEHNWAVDSITRDVCDKYDYIVFKCSKCGDSTTYDATTTDFEIKDENGNAIDIVAKYGLSTEKGQHVWSEKVAKEATCSQLGRLEKTCTKCNKLEKEDIPVIAGAHDRANYGAEGNNLKKVAAKEATCQRNGNYEYYECTRCSFSENANNKYTIVYDHADTNGDGICDMGCKESMESIYSKADGCICHKTNGFMKFVYKILKFFWKLFKINPVCECGAAHY